MSATDIAPLTSAQRKALVWLLDHNGDGGFDRNGCVLAGGEIAPHERRSWNSLRDHGLVEFYGKRPDGTGRGRLRLTTEGTAKATHFRDQGEAA